MGFNSGLKELNKGLGGPESWCRRFGSSALLPEIEPWFLGRPRRKIIVLWILTRNKEHMRGRHWTDIVRSFCTTAPFTQGQRCFHVLRKIARNCRYLKSKEHDSHKPAGHTKGIRIIWTNKMQYLLSIYFNNKSLHVSSSLAARNQENQFCINSNWCSHALCWLYQLLFIHSWFSWWWAASLPETCRDLLLK
jgi:hypothetical protein